MDIGKKIKQVRTHKKLSQKQVALSIGIHQAQYSRIESGKVEPTIKSLQKIADALQIQIIDFFQDETKSYDVNAYEKKLIDKLKLLEELDDDEKKSIFNIIDIAVSRKRLKETLANALQNVA